MTNDSSEHRVSPPGGAVDDAGDRAFHRGVEAGLASLDRGKRVPLKAVRGLVKGWIQKDAGVGGLVEGGEDQPLGQGAWAKGWAAVEDAAWRDL